MILKYLFYSVNGEYDGTCHIYGPTCSTALTTSNPIKLDDKIYHTQNDAHEFLRNIALDRIQNSSNSNHIYSGEPVKSRNACLNCGFVDPNF